MIDTTNAFFVAGNSSGIVIMNPPRSPMTVDEALTLAAWLVSIAPVATHDAEDVDERFKEILQAVRNC